MARLNRQGMITAFLFLLALGSTFLFFQTIQPFDFAIRWLFIALLAAFFEVGLLYCNLKHNHRQKEAVVLPTLGAGNALTLFRGLLLAGLAGFLFSPWPAGWMGWLPALLYTLAAIADGFDGFLARRSNHATRLGEILDVEFDALGILVATMLAVQYGQLPWWYLSLGLARYFFVFGLWWRARRGKPVHALPFSATRRLMAGFQMGFMAVILWPILFPPGTTLAGIVFALPFLAGFLRDWLIASGRIDPASAPYPSIRRKLDTLLARRLPVGLRLMLVVLAARLMLPALDDPLQQATRFVWLDIPAPHFFVRLLLIMGLFTTILVALGIAGRLAALGLLIPVSANILSTDLQLSNGLMLASTIYLMLYGTGNFSLWEPENRFLYRRT